MGGEAEAIRENNRQLLVVILLAIFLAVGRPVIWGLTTGGADGVSHVVAFLDTSLFEKFGLPSSL